MIVRQLQECEQSDRSVKSKTWQSVRMLLADDNMGFSFHITTIFADTETHMHYKNHLESVYCISGKGEIKDLATGQTHAITPGTLYVLDKHDKHILYAHEELSLACVFNPPVTGREVHDADGAYPASS
ncbi:ectoine synthase [Pseudohongiella sp.]|uniref:L-ectoine synthase n=1 Tax=marine sediment metagenome TaxID=412755 RepID=A0A0F9Z5S4_9ZZZZ|nr:ectoine synthase [Pseudohongiella sp.]MBC52728.1 L-ectoine synthase [Gammaproteobacteria bacterium]HDZ09663.1 ectoine synthase [Pseudohongiella sp.]HEA61852.1 ectoine synthase [Pseudohongiella sp.]